MGVRFALAFLLVTLPSYAAAAPPIRDGEFVGVSGTELVVGGAPFHFVGANVSVMHGARERASYETTLDAAAADGLSVVRVWAFGEAAPDAPDYWRDYAFRVGPDGWLAGSFAHLDRVLAAARARGLRVVLVLGNRWADFGGVPQYLRWHGLAAPPPESGGAEIQRFLACGDCVARYREHVRRIVSRTNTVTGVPYRDDPTIVAYEPMNESSALGVDAEATLAAFLVATAALIRDVDTHHLFSAGQLGYHRDRERRAWLRIEALPIVSYCDLHRYPADDLRIRTPADLARSIDDAAQLAHHVLHKPLVFGEFGYAEPERNPSRPPAGPPPLPRARSRASSIDAFLAAAFADGISGALLWVYEPWSGSVRRHGVDIGAPAAVDRRATDVRRVLRRWASRIAATPPIERNARLGEVIGDASLFSPLAEVAGPARDRARWERDGERWRLSLDPFSFRVARFEQLGIYDGGPVVQLWGAGRGSVEWALPSPPGTRAAPARLVVRARISSELPGAGEGATPADTSTIDVRIDDVVIGTVTAPVDDGIGRIVELVVDDAALLASAFARPGAHSLVLVAHDEPGAGGLAVYATATARVPHDPALAAELPGRIELTWEPRMGSAPPPR